MIAKHAILMPKNLRSSMLFAKNFSIMAMPSKFAIEKIRLLHARVKKYSTTAMASKPDGASCLGSPQ